MAEVLEILGFSDKANTLYSLLLERGEATAVTLAREAELHRRTVYDTLEQLKKEGLVSEKTKDDVKHYAPADPRTLRQRLAEKEARLEAELPSLVDQYEASHDDVTVEVFEGKQAMKNAFTAAIDECVDADASITMLGAGWKAPSHMEYMVPRYVEKLKRLDWRLIEPDLDEIRAAIKDNGLEEHTRFLAEKYLSPLSIITYTDMTLIVLMEPVPVLISIRGEQYADAFATYFDVFWHAAKE